MKTKGDLQRDFYEEQFRALEREQAAVALLRVLGWVLAIVLMLAFLPPWEAQGSPAAEEAPTYLRTPERATAAAGPRDVSVQTPPQQLTLRDGYALPVRYPLEKARLNLMLVTLPVPDALWLSLPRQASDGTFPVRLWKRTRGSTAAYPVEVLRVPDAPGSTVLFPVRSETFKEGDVVIVEYAVGLLTGALAGSEIQNVSGDPVTIPLVHERFRAYPVVAAPRTRMAALSITAETVEDLPSERDITSLVKAQSALELARRLRDEALADVARIIFADEQVTEEEARARARTVKHDARFTAAAAEAQAALDASDAEAFSEAYAVLLDVLLNPIGLRDAFNDEDET